LPDFGVAGLEVDGLRWWWLLHSFFHNL
jgi:hypothetical protein